VARSACADAPLCAQTGALETLAAAMRGGQLRPPPMCEVNLTDVAAALVDGGGRKLLLRM
jgi:hypothetical protein